MKVNLRMKKINKHAKSKSQNSSIPKLSVSQVLLILLSFFLIASTLTLVIYSTTHPRLDIQKRKIDVRVEDKVGFDVGTDAFHYGIIGPGNSGFRQFEVTNKKDFDMLVRITFEGEIASWMSVSEKEFLLKPGERNGLTLTMIIPEDAVYGNYTGELVSVFLRADDYQ